MQKISKKTELEKKNICHKHSNQPMSFFCQLCKKAICRDCTVLDHKEAAGHTIIDIAEADADHRQALTQQLKEGTISLTQFQGTMQQLQLEMTLLTAAKETNKKELEECIELAHKKLEERKQELIQSNEQQFTDKHNNLLGKQKPLQEAIDTITECITQAENLVKTGTLNEVIDVNQTLKTTTEQTQASLAELDLGENYVSFDSNKGKETFEESLNHLGEINIKGFLPTNMKLKDTDSRAGKKAGLALELLSYRGETLPATTTHFTATITDPEESQIQCVISTEGNEYTATFTPQISGQHKLSGLFLGQALLCVEPAISVSSNEPVLKFGKLGEGNGELNSPQAIAIDDNNCLYVADTRNQLIQKFTAEGEFVKQFSVNVHNKDCTITSMALDIKQGLLICPEVVMADKELSKESNNILIFNLEGEPQQTYTLDCKIVPHFIATDNNGDLLVMDSQSERLVRLDINGNILGHLAQTDLEGGIDDAGLIHISQDGTMIITGCDSDCLYVLNSDGTLRLKFGGYGEGKGQLKTPFGVAAEGEYIIVGERENNRIQIFKNNETFVSMIESKEDPLSDPRGLAVTSDGHVYVADHDNHCVKKYKYKDIPW